MNYDVQPESSPKLKAVEVAAANESGTGAAKEASPASTGRYFSVFVHIHICICMYSQYVFVFVSNWERGGCKVGV